MKYIKTDKDFIYLNSIKEVVDPDQITFMEALQTRRTCRTYSDTKVEREKLNKIISLSQNAASACNEQMWKFINIDDQKIHEELYLRGSAAFLNKTKQSLLVLYDNSTINKKYSDQMQSGASFISNFMLVAHTFGIGSCWICHLPKKNELRRMFNIPGNLDPVALISYGYYRGKIKKRIIKYKTGDIIYINKIEKLKKKNNWNNFFKRILIEIYYLIPPYFRKKFRKKSYPYEKKFYNHIED